MENNAVNGLKPELIWKYFYEISQIPRPSKKEEKIVEYVKEFAHKNNFEFKEDDVHNIAISVPATPGYEDKQTIVLQGHIDMVCEQNRDSNIDFENDPLVLLRDGDWITADGTTLGADNGIGVAAAMAAATDPEVVHGPLELLMTIDEETGLTGANSLQPGFIEGKLLFNLDSEEDGVFYVGCAGGQDTIGVFDIQYSEKTDQLTPFELRISGLKGGHSGMDIISGRANAIKLLGRLLHRLSKYYYKISKIAAGSKRNAIPREAEVVIMINAEDEDGIRKVISEFVADTLLEYQKTDGGLEITLKKLDGSYPKMIRSKFTRTLIDVILGIPNGVISMSPDIPGLVETSTNLATIVMERDVIRMGTSQRSSIESAKMDISGSVAAIFELAEAEVIVGDGYPGWKPNLDSKALQTAKEVYEEMYGELPDIKAIHAGLECGIFSDKYPGLDMISFGPTIQGAHSPDEKVNISDVAKFYDLLKGLLLKFAG